MLLQLQPEPQRRVTSTRSEETSQQLILEALHAQDREHHAAIGLQLDMGNKFLRRETEFERPNRGRLYAAIEVPALDANPYVAGEDGSREPVYFECVDASWLDARLLQVDRLAWYDAIADAPLYVVESLEETLPAFPAEALAGSIAWFQIDFTAVPSQAEGNGRLYQSLFDGGIPIRAEIVPSMTNPGIGASTSGAMPYNWLSHEDAPSPTLAKADVVALLESLDTSGGVAVYDVGQGAFQAALGMHGRPTLYVDMGGGVLYNRRSFPKDFVGICASDSPPVILSHWDWDHWSSGDWFEQGSQRTWIAPPVPEAPVQTAFAAKVRKNGKLLIWHTGMPTSVRAGCVLIEKCKGTTSNDSGLAVTLRPALKSRRRALLPGDAGYTHIPSVSKKGRFSAMCLSHHGGKLHSKVYPNGTPRAICANSAGPRNTYGHPLYSTLAAHLDAAWAAPLPTGYSGQRPCHVLLPWSGPPEMFRGTCHGRNAECSVALRGPVPIGLGVKPPSKDMPSKHAVPAKV